MRTTRHRVLPALALLLPATGFAQVFGGDRGASCENVPQAGGNHSVVLTGAVPVGSVLLVSAGTTGNATFGSIGDTRGNGYTVTMSRTHAALNPTYRGFSFAAPVATALQAGDSVTLTYAAAAPGGESSCVSLARFDAVSIPIAMDLQTSDDTAAINTHTINSGPTSFAHLLLHSVFVYDSVPNGISVFPGNPLQLACTAGNAFCVVPAYRITTATGSYDITSGTGNATRAVMTMAGFRGVPLVFEDGFE